MGTKISETLQKFQKEKNSKIQGEHEVKQKDKFKT